MNRLVSIAVAAGAAVALVSPAGLVGPAGAAAPDGAAARMSVSRAVPQCDNSNLVASYRDRGGAAGSTEGVIRLTNVSDQTCRTGGFGGLSYVGGGDGTQVGAAADRDHPQAVRRVVLKPGERAKSQVRATESGPYGRRCKPREVDGFRVYVPNETHAQFIAHPTTGCANPKIHLLSHKSYR